MSLIKARKGIMRVIEALFASIIILSAVVISNQFIVFPNPFTSRTKSDLEKLGYNLFFRLAQEGSFELLILSDGIVREGWENDATILIRTLLPVGVYFNLTVYEAYGEVLRPFEKQTKKITNAENQDVFVKGADVVSILYVHSMEIDGKIRTLFFVLQLTRGER